MNLARYTAERVERLTLANRSEGLADLFVVLLRELSNGLRGPPACLPPIADATSVASLLTFP